MGRRMWAIRRAAQRAQPGSIYVERQARRTTMSENIRGTHWARERSWVLRSACSCRARATESSRPHDLGPHPTEDIGNSSIHRLWPGRLEWVHAQASDTAAKTGWLRVMLRSRRGGTGRAAGRYEPGRIARSGLRIAPGNALAQSDEPSRFSKTRSAAARDSFRPRLRTRRLCAKRL